MMIISYFMPHTTIGYSDTTIYKSIRGDIHNSLPRLSNMCNIGLAGEALSYSHYPSYTMDTILPDLGTIE